MKKVNAKILEIITVIAIALKAMMLASDAFAKVKANTVILNEKSEWDIDGASIYMQERTWNSWAETETNNSMLQANGLKNAKQFGDDNSVNT